MVEPNERVDSSSTGGPGHSEWVTGRLRLLTELGGEFVEATSDVERLLALVSRRLAEVVGDSCSLHLIGEDGQTFDRHVFYSPDPDLAEAGRAVLSAVPFRVGEGQSGRVAATGVPLLVPSLSPLDMAAQMPPQFRPLIARLNVHSFLCLPLMVDGRAIGTLSMLRNRAGHPFTAEDQQLATDCARHASLALAIARSREREREARRTTQDALAALRHSEEQLKTSEARYRRIIETTTQGVWVVDDGARTTFVNRRMVEMLGYDTDQEMLGVPALDFIFPEDLTAAGRRLEQRRAGIGAEIEVRLRRKDGQELWVASTTTPVLDDSGAFQGSVSMVTDASERRRVERMLSDSNERFNTFMDAGPIMAWMKDEAGRYVYVNRTWAEVTGLDRPSALGKTDFELLTAELAQKNQQADQSVLASGEALLSVESSDDADAAKSVWQSIRFVFRGLSGDRYSGGIRIDVSAEAKAREHLHRVEEQLRQAQKMEAVGRLAAGIAHDFNNVLSVILSYGELLQSEIDAKDTRHADVGEIVLAARRAADLTRQLLMFSRQQVLEQRILDLNDISLRLDGILRRIVGEDIDLVTIPGKGLGKVLADPSSIEQVLMNLVVNARDAMPKGGRLTIETANITLDDDYARTHVGIEPGPHVALIVTDTGTGMDAATVARIFEPFFTTKAVGKGTGLGLSTVFGIVQQWRGSVWVYSEVGKGTTFKIYLPRAKGLPAETLSSPPPVQGRGTETILLVEDQAQVRAVALSILQRQGYTVITAESAAQALGLAAQHVGPIHLLLTDVVMPQMSGAELSKRLSSLRPGVKTLCMSGYTDDSIVRHGVLESEMAFLQKPFTPLSLGLKVREVLDLY